MPDKKQLILAWPQRVDHHDVIGLVVRSALVIVQGSGAAGHFASTSGNTEMNTDVCFNSPF